MAFPSLSSFTYEEPYVIVLYADSKVLGQVQKFSGSTKATRPKKTLRRVGDDTAYTARGAAEYESTASCTFFTSDDMADVLAALSITSGNSLDASETVTLKAEIYDNNTASGAVIVTYQLTNAHPILQQFDVDANGDAAQDTINWESDDKWTITVS